MNCRKGCLCHAHFKKTMATPAVAISRILYVAISGLAVIIHLGLHSRAGSSTLPGSDDNSHKGIIRLRTTAWAFKSPKESSALAEPYLGLHRMGFT